MSKQTNILPDNPQIEVIKSSKTGLFTNYIFKAIPLAFDESMSYYETLCGLLHYLKNTIIPTVNNNANAVAELQTLYEELRSYVDDYFKGLDVQEEINNKLDEMVKQGTLQEIITDYLNSKAIFGYDNVESMKNATNLINGSYAQTLGYYNKNDDGGALYKIRSITNEDIVDEMFIISLSDETLIAELIINNTININCLGADNTGLIDSSNIFNTALQKISTNWYNQNTRINTITVNGKYKIENQVIIPPFAKIKGTGYVTFLTNVSGSAFKIDYLSTEIPTFEGNKQDWLQGELINLSQGGLFKNIGENFTNTCIEIGRNTDIGVYLPYSRYKLCNFRIYNYNIAILHNKYHNYIGKFDNISFESNTIGVQYGIESGTVIDSGENMTYINCLFAQGTDAIKWFTDGFDSSFVNCSFDFLNNIFNDYENRGYKRISLINCHLEGFTTLCNKLGQYAMLDFNDCEFVFTQHGDMFTNINNYSQINFSLCKFLPNSQTIYDPSLLLDTSIPSKLLFNNLYGHGNTYNGFAKNNLLTNFDTIPDGDITLKNNNWYGDLQLIDKTSGFTASIVTDNYLYTGHKSLVLTVNTESTDKKSILFRTDFISVENINSLISNIFYYNCRGTDQIKYFLYDNKQNLIYESDWYHYIPTNSNKKPNVWYMSSVGKKLVFPVHASYVKIQFNVINMNNDTADVVNTQYKIGGFITN